MPREAGADRELLFDNPEATGVAPVLDKGEWEDSYVIVMPMAEKSLLRHLSNASDALS